MHHHPRHEHRSVYHTPCSAPVQFICHPGVNRQFLGQTGDAQPCVPVRNRLPQLVRREVIQLRLVKSHKPLSKLLKGGLLHLPDKTCRSNGGIRREQVFLFPPVQLPQEIGGLPIGEGLYLLFFKTKLLYEAIPITGYTFQPCPFSRHDLHPAQIIYRHLEGSTSTVTGHCLG